MKPLLLLLLTSFFCNILAGQSLFVERSEILSDNNIEQVYNNSLSGTVKEAIDSVEKYLLNSHNVTSNDNEACYMLTQALAIPYQFILYELYGIDKIYDDSIILIVNTYLYAPLQNIKHFKGYFKIGYSKTKKSAIFPVINGSYKLFNFSAISFYSKHDNYTNFQKADEFVSRMLRKITESYNQFKIPEKKLRYIVGDNEMNALKFWGLTHFFFTSRYLREIHTIVDTQEQGFYKHELIHYILSHYKMSSFLSEGLATFLSGGQISYQTNVLEQLKKMKYKLMSDEDYKTKIDSGNPIFEGAFGSEMYCISSILLFEYSKKVGENIFYQNSLGNLSKMDNKKVLEFLMSMLSIKSLSKYLLDYNSMKLKEIQN